jgi:hypothetical protein
MLRFKSTAFPPAKYEDPDTNPDMHAKAVADWLSEALKSRGIETTGVYSEDFAWCVGVPDRPRDLYVACGSVEGRASLFEVTYFSIGDNLWSDLFGRKKTAENLKRLHRSVKELLAADPKITELREEA